MYNFGYVGINGRPNAGKSTLIKRLVGEKVAIVSSKPQTTRDNILGIMNGKNYQVVLVDTPGVHHSKNKLDRYMMKNVRSVLGGVDLVLYLLDGTKSVDEEERDYIDKLKSMDAPVLVVRTKTDKANRCDYDTDLTVSALSGQGIEQLKERLLEYMSESQTKNFLYDEDEYTDKSVKYLIAESVREECLNFFKHEIPHGIAISVVKFEEKPSLTIIEIDIVCEEERHKGIIIGKGGINLKRIGEKVRHYSEELLGGKVLLKLFVKVEKDWRNNPNKLRNLGFE